MEHKLFFNVLVKGPSKILTHSTIYTHGSSVLVIVLKLYSCMTMSFLYTLLQVQVQINYYYYLSFVVI